MTSWLITDGTLWRKLTPSRQDDIKSWLRMNGIDPHRVPIASPLCISGEGDDWRIEYERYLVDEETGHILVCPDKLNEAYIEECTTPLAIDPPMEWLIPECDVRPAATAGT